MLTPWRLQTARLAMTPVASKDQRDLIALKRDPRAFAQMLGGVRSAQQTMEDLAHDIRDWGQYGFGMWSVRLRDGGNFLGIAGIAHRQDDRGVALRFALWPEARGIGLASEAAVAALNYGHEIAGLGRVIAVAREENFSSRMVLGAVGMAEIDAFIRDGVRLLIYQSIRQQNAR